jgi:hypothetical protein
MIRGVPAVFGAIAAALLLASIGGTTGPPPSGGTSGTVPMAHSGTPSAVGNFTAAINRMVELVGLAGSGILALVWARVALSWFSNDVTKKIQAKDRARDALVGSLLFTAAVTGLAWGLAHWVITGA